MAFLVRLGKSLVVGAGGVFVFNKVYDSDLSLNFYGKTQEWENELNKDLGFNLGEVGSLGMEFIIKSSVPGPFFRPELAAQELVEKYPKLHIGHTLLASHYKNKNETQKMIKSLEQSHKIAEKFPEENKKLAVPVPTREDIYEIPWEIERKEVVPGKIWFVTSPFFPEEGKCIDLAGYIFKKKDGTVLLVNPVSFDEETIDFIKSLGEVSAVVSPCIGHMDCWKECMKTFPKAEFYHVESQRGVPKDIKTHILDAGVNPFSEDLEMVRMQGHIFKETMFIHKESKTLLGPIDMSIPTGGYKAYGFHVYALAMGLNRGYKETEPIALQCYHHVFVTDRQKLRSSVKELLSHDIETLLHGHIGHNGGVVERGGREELRKIYAPYLDDSVTPSYLDRFYLFWKFFGKARLSREFWAKFQ